MILRKREIEIFKVKRNYREFVERLGVEMVDNNNEYVPCIKAEMAAIVDDDNNDNNYLPCEVKGVAVDNDENNDFITYLIVTNYTEGDRTIPYDDKLYDKLIWNKPINSNDIVEEYKILNKYYIDNNNICLLYTSRCV